MMKIHINTQNISLRSDTLSYLGRRLKKLEKLTAKDDSPYCEVLLSRETTHDLPHGQFVVELKLTAGQDHLFAKAAAETMPAAIDGAKKELVRSLVSTRGKQETMWKKGGAKVKEALKRLKF